VNIEDIGRWNECSVRKCG